MAPFKTDPRDPRPDRIVPEKLSLVAILLIAGGVPGSRHARNRMAESEDDVFRKHSEVTQSKGRETSFFPVAVWYSGGKARAPMLETVTPDSPRLWKEDLSKIKELGFNSVRTWVEWNVGEPEEGKYHLENLDLLLRLANEAELKVIVQVYVDSAPEWVGKKYPDGRYAAQDGQPIPSQAAPGYCFDHRGVRT